MSLTISNADDSTPAGGRIVEQWTEVNGDRIPYLTAGESGSALVLIHGGAASRMDWVDNIAALAASYRVFAPDLAGFGDAPRREIPHTIRYLADFVTEFVTSVGLRQAVMVGHSLGARVCLEAARTHPELVTGMVLLAPMGFGRISMIGRALSTAAWGVSRALRRRLPYPNLEVDLVEPDPNTFASMRCPTLILWGSRDPYFPLAHAAVAVNMIPDARLKVYRGAGHGFHRTNREELAADALSFLAEQGRR